MVNIVFLINPRSGTPKFILRLEFLIKKHLRRGDFKYRIEISKNGDNICELAARAVQEGADIVVAVGGDGTVNQAAQGVINSPTALGVLPTGSGNGFARNMNIPLRLDRAMAVIHQGKVVTIDVGLVDDRIFLVSCGIGWEAVIATIFEGSFIRGILPYAGAAFSTFLQYEPQEITIQARPDDWEYRGRPMLFSVANMRQYGVGVTIAPEADCRDGKLDICLLPRHSLVNALKYTPEMFRQRTDTIPGYVHHKASEVIIHRHLAGNIHLDGTPLAAGHKIEIRVVPQALKIIIPRGKQ